MARFTALALTIIVVLTSLVATTRPAAATTNYAATACGAATSSDSLQSWSANYKVRWGTSGHPSSNPQENACDENGSTAHVIYAPFSTGSASPGYFFDTGSAHLLDNVAVRVDCGYHPPSDSGFVYRLGTKYEVWYADSFTIASDSAAGMTKAGEINPGTPWCGSTPYSLDTSAQTAHRYWAVTIAADASQSGCTGYCGQAVGDVELNALDTSVPSFSAVYVCLPGTTTCDGTEGAAQRGWSPGSFGAVIRVVTGSDYTAPCTIVLAPDYDLLNGTSEPFGADTFAPSDEEQATTYDIFAGRNVLYCTNTYGAASRVLTFRSDGTVTGTDNERAAEVCDITDPACGIRQLIAQVTGAIGDIGNVLVHLFVPRTDIAAQLGTLKDAALDHEPFYTLNLAYSYTYAFVSTISTDIAAAGTITQWCYESTISIWHGTSSLTARPANVAEDLGSGTMRKITSPATVPITICLDPGLIVGDNTGMYRTSIRPLLGYTTYIVCLVAMWRQFAPLAMSSQ